MNNRLTSVIRSSLLLLLVAIGTAGCATGGLAVTTPEQRAEQLAKRGSHEDAASAYIGLATSATGSERDRLTLLAIEQWLEAGDGRRARNALRRMPAPPSGELLWLWSSNAAALALFEGRPEDAQRILEPLSRQALPMTYRLRVEALMADSWFQLGDPIRALSLYRQRETWLDTSQDVARNQQRIWAGLLASNPAKLRTAADETFDPELKGWLTLGALAASTGRQGIGWANGVNRWQQAYPDHPAMTLLQGMELPAPGEVEYPLHIALLLPLSGDNASAGIAVQNGFFGAYFSAASQLDKAQQVAVYDTGGSGGASFAYAEAIADGAEFVVGPLLRDSVIAVANEGMLPIPVLALNYLPDEIPAPPGLYQFALSPEDEAASAARRAVADGHTRALALVPNNDWGTRLLQSFAREFEAAGGTLLDARDYQASNQDFSYEIESLMLLSQSVQRYQRLRANIGGPLQFDPRRREDAEFIFLAATAPVARLLKSQLKFHYAGDLPVYSTSRIHSMDGRSNSDLNGVMFADTPWVIAPQPWIAELPDLYAEYWPAERRMGRLHALGYDAYHLVAALFAARFDDMKEIDGATGVLYLDADGRVHRQLAWARFQGGKPVAMPDNSPGVGDPRFDEDLPGESADTPRDSTWLEPTRRQ
ncbi:MAG: penicillin-binding protein activator [Woeseia sp.]